MGKNSFLLALAILFLLLFLGAARESFADTDSKLQQAQNYFDNSDYQKAEQIYQSIIKQRSDIDEALEAQKGLVMVYISLGKQAEAETAYQQLLSNFPHNTHMADVIHHGIASLYRKYKKTAKADELDKYVLENWPTAESALWAQVDIVGASINRKDYAAAQVGVDNLFASFSKNEYLCDAIHSIASRYRQAQKTTKADELDQHVLNHWPTTESAMWAQVDIVGASINRKDYAAAQVGIDNLLTRFPDNENMANVLHGMAYKYRQSERTAKADKLDKYVLKNWPTAESAMWAQVDIVGSSINRKDYAAAQVSVDNLFAGFAKNEHLCDAVHSIAYRYRQARKTAKADKLDQYVLDHWPTAESAMWAQVDIINSNIDSRNYATAHADINNLLTHFSGNENMANALHSMAYKYRKSERTATADELDKYVLNHWPSSEIALWARVDYLKSVVNEQGYAIALTNVDELLTDFANEEQLVSGVLAFQIIDGERELNQNEKAEQFYKKLINNWPGHKDTLWSQTIAVLANIRLGDIAATDAAIAKLRADFSTHPKFSDAILIIAEKYYEEGLFYYTTARLTNLEVDIERKKEFYRKAIEIWEKVIKEFPNSEVTIHVYYSSAVCYAQELSEYQKGIDYFQTIVDNWPKYKYAWNAQYFVGEYYEKLMNSGAIPKSEAIPKIEKAYKAVVEKYPNCEMVENARLRLARINSDKGKFF